MAEERINTALCAAAAVGARCAELMVAAPIETRLARGRTLLAAPQPGPTDDPWRGAAGIGGFGLSMTEWLAAS